MKNYEPIIGILRDYRDYLENPNNTKEDKRRQYSKTTGYVFGYIRAWNLNNLKERFTSNDIDLLYGYIDRLYDKHIMNK